MEDRIAGFINGSQLEWKDISDEQYRCYSFPGGEKILVKEPRYLNVNERNNHRIITAEGNSVYIPYKWLALEWKVKDGKPLFAF